MKVPDNVSESLKTILDVNDLHAGVLLDYLTKVSRLNKKLIDHVQNLNDKLCVLSEKIDSNESVEPVTRNSTHDPVAVNHRCSTLSADVIASSNQNNDVCNNELSFKLDDLEQKSNSNVLLCKGEIIN